MSEIHSSFILLFCRGRTRSKSKPLKSSCTEGARTSTISLVYTRINSQFLALKANGFDVSAPTGHKSIMFPESSLVINLGV